MILRTDHNALAEGKQDAARTGYKLTLSVLSYTGFSSIK